jgi:hypothetical protein
MMGLSFLCFILFACVYAEVDEKDAIIRRGGHLISFEAFKLKYNKNYPSPREHQKRQTIFQENLKVIKSLNEREGSTIYGVNKFSDLSRDEFRARYLMQKGNFKDSNPSVVGKKEFHFKDQAFPGTFDWRSKSMEASYTLTIILTYFRCRYAN